MNLEEQFKVIFYSFIYGMFFLATLRMFLMLKIKKIFQRFITELIFLLCHATLFYFLLYKINNGIISIYIPILFILGMAFCHFLYFEDKKRWNIKVYYYIIII